MHSLFNAIKHLKLSNLCDICLKWFNLPPCLRPSYIAYASYFNMYTVNTLFITSYLNIEVSTKTL